MLDNATGGLTVVPVVDSAATAEAPVGGVQTGGGYLAEHPRTSEATSPWATVLGWFGV